MLTVLYLFWTKRDNINVLRLTDPFELFKKDSLAVTTRSVQNNVVRNRAEQLPIGIGAAFQCS